MTGDDRLSIGDGDGTIRESDAIGPLSRGRAWIGLVGLGSRQVFGRLQSGSGGRVALCMLGVALAIGLLTVTTGVAVGVAAGGTVESDGVDYWIVPDDGHTASVPLATEGARLGSVHEVTAELAADDRIDYVTPVAIEPLLITHPDTGERMYVLGLGVVPPGHDRTVSGIEVGALDPSYEHYDDGSYEGEWSGEAVVTSGVATQLGVTVGEEFDLAGDRRIRVVDVAERDLQAGFGDVSAVVMPLAELQTATGLADGDRADQIMIASEDRGVREELEGVYPGTNVVTRGGLAGMEITPTNLPLAMALAASVVAGGIGVAFVATMMGLEVTANRRELATLAVVGFSARSRAVVVTAEAVTVTVAGGLLGVALGAVGLLALNAGVARGIGVPAVGTLTPWIVAYGLGVAVLIGIVSAPYLSYLGLRTDTLEELSR